MGLLNSAFDSFWFCQWVLKEENKVKMPLLHHLQPDVPFTFLKAKIWGFYCKFYTLLYILYILIVEV